MQQGRHVNVTGVGGLRGTIDTTSWPLDGSKSQVLVRFDDGREVMAATNALEALPDGSYRLPLGGTDLDRLTTALREHGDTQAVVPVIEEAVAVGKRTVETGKVRVTKVVSERQQTIDNPLLREEVSVERVPVNRVVDGPLETRHEGDTIVVPVLEEVLVIEKRLMLKEEVRITRRRSETRDPQTVTLRREDVQIERSSEPGEDGAGTPVATPQRAGGPNSV